jgi:hypothetical protein
MPLLLNRKRLLLPVFAILAAIFLLGQRPGATRADGGIFLVASMGDSIASGEGAPDVPKGPNPWDSPTWSGQPGSATPTVCHRSNKAGPALAYNNLIRPVYQSSYFDHVACSGAGIVNGLETPQLYDNRTTKVPLPQINQVQSWMGNFPNHRLDALFLSIGANDVHFANVVQACVLETACENDSTLVNNLSMDFSNLDRLYDDLAAQIQVSLNPAKVFITEYQDPMHKTATSVCNAEPAGDWLGNITADEATWASQNLVNLLNAKVNQAAQRHGWQVVAAQTDFVGHAYCSPVPWVNANKASQAVQGDDSGTIHPNYSGYSDYAHRIADAFFAVHPPPPTVPAAPTNLWDKVTFIGEIEKHTLMWRDNSQNETSFVVSYQVDDSGPWNTINRPYNSTSYPVGNFPVGHTYTFFVQACNSFGCSLPTNTVSVSL